MGFAQIAIEGNLGRDAELKDAGGSQVLKFSVAVNDYRTDSTAWYDCVIWGKRGASLAASLTKGTSVVVGGQFTPRPWKTKDGEDRLSLDIEVTSFDFTGSGGGSKQDDAPADPAPSDPPADDDIPF